MTNTLLFASEKASVLDTDIPPWKVLIVDDEEGVHRVTRLVLKNVTFDNRPIELLEARSASEARTLCEQHGTDIALALVDVVMETEDAGLKLVRTIRDEFANHMTRIVLRTGQPGQAPEEQVIQEYDINDYKDKTELTGTKLKTLLYSSLRSYRDIKTIDRQRKSLETVIHAIGQINQVNSLSKLASAILSQLISLLNFEPDSIYCCTRRIYRDATQFTVLAATGALQPLMQNQQEEDVDSAMTQYNEDELPPELQAVFNQALREKQSIHTHNGYIAYHSGLSGTESLLYIKHHNDIDDHAKHLLEIFSADVIATYHTLLLKEEIQETQAELVYILGESVERRSKETGGHVKRVAEISALLAEAYGKNQMFVENMRLASPLHDLGKIAIPDAILNKPGKLDSDEWKVMKTHAEIGEAMLGRSERPIFQLAARIAGTHHERWDGTGYPRGLSGDEIPLSGRITAVADVFDALNSKRCYKADWPLEETLALMEGESGKQFDPQLITLFKKNLDAILQICKRFPD